MLSLYRRILGREFDALPAVLRLFHDAAGGGSARASFRIDRARGFLQNTMATIMGLPASGNEVPVRLQVLVQGDREHWVRHFQGQRVESVQWVRDDVLMEQFGPVVFSCRLVIDGSILRYEFQESWFGGVPLPRSLAPFVESYVKAEDCKWWVMVRIFAPLLGEIIKYEGWVEPE